MPYYNYTKGGRLLTTTEKDRDESLWARIRDKLEENGVFLRVDSNLAEFGLGKLDDLDLDVDLGEKGSGIKVVCMAPDLKASADEMNETPRDKVVMVRVDEKTREELDAWVETGAVKSRSEAAALFIREGLAVRSDELARLRDALREVEEARERLRSKASEVFGGGADGADGA